MDLMKALNTRYSTKSFDPTKKLSQDDIETIEKLLQLAPSSTNVQPWHFVMATTDEGKQRVAKASQGFFSFNEPKILNASAVIVFATKADITEDHLLRILEKEKADGRFANAQVESDTHKARSTFVNIHKNDIKDAQHWAEKQVYLNLGNLLLGLSTMGLDALPMEGLDMNLLDEELGLNEKGFTSTFAVAVGYKAPDDYNAELPKSRLPREEIITYI